MLVFPKASACSGFERHKRKKPVSEVLAGFLMLVMLRLTAMCLAAQSNR